MDELRWVLLVIGVVIVAAIYLAGRIGRERAARADSPSRQFIEEADTLTESFSAKEEEASNVSAWTEPVPAAHDPDAVDVNWAAAADVSREEPAAGVEPEIVASPEPAILAQETPPPRKAAHPAAPAVNIDPLILVLSIMAPAGQPWSGERLQRALESEGLRHGDMDIFHFHQAEHEDAVFSVANAVEPGVFDLALMSELASPGVTLFCQLPGPLAGDEAFDLMLDRARAIAEKLDGHLCDDRRNALTMQAVSHYHDRIETFSRGLALAKKKAAEKA